MNFTKFQQLLPKLKSAKLPGLDAQFKLAPEIRKRYSEDMIQLKNPRQAGVLALFYPDVQNETRFLLTLRASYNGTHSAQISFPGGKIEEQDKNLEQTATRETYEEIGITVDSIKVIKEFTDAYIPPSNFLVTPFLGYLDYIPKFKSNHEVAEIIEVKLSDLLDESKLVMRKRDTSYMSNVEVPCFQFEKHIVWGATAMILSEIKSTFERL
ncbi:NUDIX hydrolase [Urechidicola vernalis]|uniref:CoA pyrophosphatase n=1 Tax=Urechidicola vernalis TaxID=3075600 RepID=A0ABU2Y0S5_9FLAO|nr:CoA pyrophosphatase [Urechidicola sp. P050]MDT0551768.1 CoA pyrophosphatase [Urechidicola sp. P050]